MVFLIIIMLITTIIWPYYDVVNMDYGGNGVGDTGRSVIFTIGPFALIYDKVVWLS